MGVSTNEVGSTKHIFGVDEFVYTIRQDGCRHCERKNGVVLESPEDVSSVNGTFEQARLVFIYFQSPPFKQSWSCGGGTDRSMRGSYRPVPSWATIVRFGRVHIAKLPTLNRTTDWCVADVL